MQYGGCKHGLRKRRMQCKFFGNHLAENVWRSGSSRTPLPNQKKLVPGTMVHGTIFETRFYPRPILPRFHPLPSINLGHQLLQKPPTPSSPAMQTTTTTLRKPARQPDCDRCHFRTSRLNAELTTQVQPTTAHTTQPKQDNT